MPRPGDPQAFNRYAYSRNSPTVRIDPSGHGDCPVLSSGSCQPGWHGILRNVYGIKFTGNWFKKFDYYDTRYMSKAYSVLRAAERIETRFRQIDRSRANCSLCGATHKADGAAWRAVYRNVEVRASTAEKGYGGQTFFTQNLIELYPPSWQRNRNSFDFQANVIHEFGHLFAGRALDRSASEQRKPYTDLVQAKIEAYGVQIAGGATLRRDDGYRSKGLPYQQHRGAPYNEDFADMFLNWTLGSFADDDAGDARNDWMNENAPSWIDLAVEAK